MLKVLRRIIAERSRKWHSGLQKTPSAPRVTPSATTQEKERVFSGLFLFEAHLCRRMNIQPVIDAVSVHGSVRKTLPGAGCEGLLPACARTSSRFVLLHSGLRR